MSRLALAALLLLALAGRARAEIGAVDVVPAATLLVPYFEVDPVGMGINTIVTVTNVEATATLAHVTLWTDMAVPVFGWDIYLTGFDQTTIDLRLLFRGGVREVTAPDGADASCTGTLPIQQQMLPAARTALGLAFSGQASVLLGDKCGGSDFGDGLERGFITIDVTSACTTKVPGDTGYFAAGGTGIASNRNVLTGHYELRNPAQNFAQQDPVVHIEASATDPATGSPEAATFYRSRMALSIDNRERLPSIWQARYAARGASTTGPAAFPWSTTDLLVWRDPGAAMVPFACHSPRPVPFPLTNPPLAIYDEGGTSRALPGNFFPLAAARVPVGSGPLFVPFPVGLLSIDLNMRQGHVTIVHTAEGRFSTGVSAFPVGAIL